MSYAQSKCVMSLFSVTVLLWALRQCALSRQSCHGHKGRQWVLGGRPASPVDPRNCKSQNPIQNQQPSVQSTTLKNHFKREGQSKVLPLSCTSKLASLLLVLRVVFKLKGVVGGNGYCGSTVEILSLRRSRD